ncbi:MAG: diguanylate cyclase domain-containing protein [Actinomycetota bacterium]
MRNRAITVYLGLGATAIVAYFLLPDVVGSAIWGVIAFSMPVAVMLGVRRSRPERPTPLYVLAAGLAFWALGDVLWIVVGGGSTLGPGDAAYVAAYILMALGCLFLVKGDRRTSMLALVDALVGACGLAVIVWDVVLSKGVEGSGLSFATLVNASYPVLDILLLTLLVRLAMAERTAEPAFWGLIVGFSLVLATDLAYSWLERGTPDPSGPLLDLGWLAGYLAIGAAALHPSMARLTQRTAPEALLSPIRVMWLGIPILTVPILMLATARRDPADIVVQSVAALAMGALVLVRIVFSAKDQDRAHREARTAEIEYRAVFEGSPVAILKVADGGDILDANPAAERLFGFEGGIAGRHMRDILLEDERDGSSIRDSVEALVAGAPGARATWDVRVRRGDGSSFEAGMTTSIVADPSGGVEFGISAVEDVTMKRQDEERLRFRALHDPLTGLPNRDLLDEGLRSALARARRAGTQVAVMFLDLDGFKDVNDRMGHAVGDDVLRALAERLVASARGGDMVARLGGDEFVIVVEDVRSEEQAEASTARFLDEVRRPVVLGGTRVTLDASIGLVVAGAADMEPDEILRRADSAMYEAKRAGRGGWCRFGAETSAGLGA